MNGVEPLFKWPDKNHPWYEATHDAASDVARYWMDMIISEDDSVLEFIDDRAADVGLGWGDVEGDFDRFSPFMEGVVFYARQMLIGMLVAESTDASQGVRTQEQKDARITH